MEKLETVKLVPSIVTMAIALVFGNVASADDGIGFECAFKGINPTSGENDSVIGDGTFAYYEIGESTLGEISTSEKMRYSVDTMGITIDQGSPGNHYQVIINHKDINVLSNDNKIGLRIIAEKPTPEVGTEAETKFYASSFDGTTNKDTKDAWETRTGFLTDKNGDKLTEATLPGAILAQTETNDGSTMVSDTTWNFTFVNNLVMTGSMTIVSRDQRDSLITLDGPTAPPSTLTFVCSNKVSKSDDIDGDGITDDIDPDKDGDGVLNNADNDIDGDGVLNDADNNSNSNAIINQVQDDLKHRDDAPVSPAPTKTAGKTSAGSFDLFGLLGLFGVGLRRLLRK